MIIAPFFLISELTPETSVLSLLWDESLGLNVANNSFLEAFAIRGWLNNLARKGLL